MEEIKISPEEKKEIPLKEKIDLLFQQLNPEQTKKEKTKKLKIPRKAKVKKRKLKKGWLGILKVDENGNISAEKQRIFDSTFKLKDGTYHSTDGREILFWQGKFPVIIQPSWKKNPIQIRKEQELNETYGQKYIRARMLSDTIKVKSGVGGKAIIWIIGIAIAAYIGYKLITGGL